MSNAYKSAGVDIEAGYEAVSRMKKHVQKTMRPQVLNSLGGFGGMFDLSGLNLREPVLVSGTDGVGTKLLLAMMMDKHESIGIDCVAMCVNDIVVQGAEPLYFLDYIACGKAEPEKIESIVKGIADGCVQAGCALIGGETAEMPGLYSDEEYDLAGFTVGACEKQDLITGETILAGDCIIGLASSGIHSNGYSLVRKVLLEDAEMDLFDFIPELGCKLGDELLKPTKIYVKSILAALRDYEIKGMAHITGGGFVENFPRMMPESLGVEIESGTWEIPPIFKFLEQKGSIPREDMYNIFNMGIGMALVVKEDAVDALIAFFEKHGEQAYRIGRVVNEPGVMFIGES
ncbi:phosphoribosylformylglycinamidine cyclo-ligase [Sporosarcina aquimarina]|uniref:Phosphoribosylformylglycinamidine cyclo-ligase n=1 Tax=Sporosarcina aquimarina TaxID=114975 RepID=A0ABU4FXV4_9BACL|nr:phosphoribosylformylglycinamidine cyclo-ligase [Sporosarcina aquimarina]MDW0109533.1 phosphoribosylformylglycinamidine cyclo-ligase [Sporosarcina aquimarina]